MAVRPAVHEQTTSKMFVRDALKRARMPGVGRAHLSASASNRMRWWVDPDPVASRGLTPATSQRVREQNVQVAAGTGGAATLAPVASSVADSECARWAAYRAG